MLNENRKNNMALIIPVRGFTPEIGEDVFLAENATIIGDTVIGDGCRSLSAQGLKVRYADYPVRA